MSATASTHSKTTRRRSSTMSVPMRLFDRSKGTHKSSSSILPTRAPSPRRDGRSLRAAVLPRKYARLGSIAVFSLCAVSVFYLFEWTQSVVNAGRMPPLYERYHKREAQLPQHDVALPYPEGKDMKFFWASNHVVGSGWGNAMQELLLNAHLAHVTKRAFVFDNFTWNRDDPLYSTYNGKLIPARIPLSAMITGPLVGGPFLSGPPDVPRAVSRNYFYERCPNRTIIDTDEVTNDSVRYDESVGAAFIFDKWVEKLNGITDPCVEIRQGSDQLFDIRMFGSGRILDIWPTLSKSPILTQFGWSPLIRSAFNTNIRLFRPPQLSSWLSYLLSAFSSLSAASGLSDPASDSDAPYPGLLVLHIRRGDFEQHCHHLANWSSDFNGFNKFPALPDTFTPPSGGGWGETTPENRAMYLGRCYPEVADIVRRVMEIKREEQARGGGEGDGLKAIYVMTNAAKPWLEELTAALMREHRWDQVTSSRDLKLSWEQKYVAQTVDMTIGQRAQVFVGNGFSSLTSNIVMLRMAKGVPPESNRFW